MACELSFELNIEQDYLLNRNLSFDDKGLCLSLAPGRMANIAFLVCERDFAMCPCARTPLALRNVDTFEPPIHFHYARLTRGGGLL